MAINSYRDLRVWRAAIDLAVECYKVTKAFPNNESFGMTSQLRGVSASVGANIAEGYGREHRGSFIQFLRIAQGSLKEMETHLIICGEVGLLQPTDRERLLDKSDETGKMLRALIRSLQKKG